MKILSLTGFGRSTFQMPGLTLTVEIKSVNGKSFDLFMKIPANYNELEMGIRKQLQEQLIRGSVNVLVTKQDTRVSKMQLNKPLLEKLIAELNEITPQTESDKNYLLAALVRLPDAIQNVQSGLEQEEINGLIKAFNDAAMQLTQFRLQEGENMKKDLLRSCENILIKLKEVEIIAPERNKKMKDDLIKKLTESGFGEKIDNNRLEQELIYYTEKLDVNEECVRLKNHCAYFKETIEGNDDAKGRKLSFIAQEMVREINTTGSKANNADMQKIVVQMKDEAEKIKELILNIL
jgi:uncharacterized protein (TIGR00255 family)